MPPPYGGVSVYVSALFEHLRPCGVRLWALFGDRPTRDPLVRSVNHRRFGLLAAIVAEGRGALIADCTHFHLEHPHRAWLPTWLALKRRAGFRWVKIILDGTLPMRHAKFGDARRRMFHRAVAAVDEFVVVSEELRRWLEDEIKVAQRVTVIPCLLTIPARALNVKLPAETERAVAPFFARARRVVSVGVFTPEYGFGDAASAVERLRAETGEDVGLLLVDGAFLREDDYREEVLRGREWITVLENVPNSHVYQLLRRADAFVRAFGYESYGISRIEAIWCGVPVVATTAGETRGMLTYEFGDVEALARQLGRALYGASRAELATWAEVYRREAAQNLRALEDVLGLTRDCEELTNSPRH